MLGEILRLCEVNGWKKARSLQDDYNLSYAKIGAIAERYLAILVHSLLLFLTLSYNNLLYIGSIKKVYI